MFIRSISKKMTRACPSIYLTGAKLGTPVYWARRIIGLDYRKVGNRIARLHEKYGDNALEKKPGCARHAYYLAARYAPGWKTRLDEKKWSAFEKCGLLVV